MANNISVSAGTSEMMLRGWRLRGNTTTTTNTRLLNAD